MEGHSAPGPVDMPIYNLHSFNLKHIATIEKFFYCGLDLVWRRGINWSPWPSDPNVAFVGIKKFSEICITLSLHKINSMKLSLHNVVSYGLPIGYSMALLACAKTA